jgi:UDP-4-keto-D-QuiNAc 4-reductase
MRILVTGASGFIGTALCRELLRRGHSVVGTSRNAQASGTGVREIAVPDLAGEFDRKALLRGVDAVVHLAAIAHRSGRLEPELRRVNVEATARLAEAAEGAVRRFVFLSSVKVHGEDSGSSAFRETDALRPRDVYGASKAEAEEALTRIAARSGMELVLMRPPLVYGPEVKANFLRLLGWIDSGLPLPFASVNNRRSLIYLGNLTDVIARCVESARAGGVLLVSDEEAVSTPELVSRIALALGRTARLLPVPPALLRAAGALLGLGEYAQRLTGNLVVDASRTRELLDWRPPHSLDHGLAETAAWFRTLRRRSFERTR